MCRATVAPKAEHALAAVLCDMRDALARLVGVDPAKITIGPVDFGPPDYKVPQDKPICVTCADSIIWVPGNGFGRDGEWRHLAPPRSHVPAHDVAPKVFIT